METKQKVQVDESVTMDNTVAGKENQTRNKPERLQWLQDAGMGLFIHWSLDVQLGCVISHTLVGASKAYTDQYFDLLPQTLNPKAWDFDQLASLAKLAGFRYAVFTTKHHNGFCCWDTQSTDFNCMNTPYGKDIVRQYVQAMRKQGIAVGLYFSPEDFCYLRRCGLPITRTPQTPYTQTEMEGYRALLTQQMTELMENYGKIDILFFDGGESMVDEQGESLQQLCMRIAWDKQPDVLITRGAIPTPEQQLPGVGAEEVWEGCMTLGTAWQYQPTNEIYKDGLHVIRLLTETRAKGGSLLLNIGPDANGALCREQEGLLRELALWHFINGEAIHDTRPWVLTNEGDIWYLKKKDGSALYAVIFGQNDWDRGVRKEFLLRSVQIGPDSTVEVLGQSGAFTEYRPDLDVHTRWQQKEEGLWVSAVHAQRIYCGIQWRNPLVLKITNPTPAFRPMAVTTAHGLLNMAESGVTAAAKVETLGSFSAAQVFFEYRVYPGFALSSYETGWQSTAPQTVTQSGVITGQLGVLTPGVTYQYRAVLHNEKITMRGEMHLFTP